MSIKIAMLTTFYPPHNFGGDGIGIKRLATALAERGCEITVVYDQDAYLSLAPSPPAPVQPDPGIRVVALSSRLGAVSNLLTHQLGYPLVHGSRIGKLLREGAFDVIWYHNISLVGGPGLLALGNAVKIYEAHEHWLVCPTHVLWRYNRELCDRRECLRCTLSYRRPPQLWRYAGLLDRRLDHVDAFIAKSEFSRQMHRQFGFGRDMRVVPYFLPDEPAGQAVDSPRSRPYFLFVGRLEKIKGVQDIIPAFSGSDGPELVVVGSGDYESELRSQAAGYPRVVFTGRLSPEQLSAYYQNATALIVPSVCYETFGIILIEAARSGTPVIARRIGPFPEIVERGGGILFDSAEELRSAVELLGTDAACRDRLAREGRSAFERHWRKDVVLGAYVGVLRDAARARSDHSLLGKLERLT